MRNDDKPVVALRRAVPCPVVVTARWRLVGRPGVLVKTYEFRDRGLRDAFVVALLGEEAETGASSELLVRELQVTVTLVRTGLGVVTELEREHARACDVLFREVMYSAPHNDDPEGL